jgi:hypothetical protein
MFDFGLLHKIEELSGISRKALDIAALSFGVEGVERQTALAGAGESGDDHKFIAGDDRIDLFEVVLFSPLDDDIIDHILSFPYTVTRKI